MKLDFVRGHMGGNLIILLRGEQIPAGRELETAVKLMGPNYLYGHEAGILYQTGQLGRIAVKIAEPTVPCFINACGGFTQVLGAALIETDLGKLFGIESTSNPVEVILETECGLTPLIIETDAGKARRIKTDMSGFVADCYKRGVRPLRLSNLEVMQSGKFLIINADKFRKVYPDSNFYSWNSLTREAVTALQDDFMAETGEKEPNVAVYDWYPEQEGNMRVIFPHYVRDNFFEPSCGTGSVALALAAFAAGELNRSLVDNGETVTLNIESGGGIELGGPDLTAVEMQIEGDKARAASFSHSRVEITSTGEARLP